MRLFNVRTGLIAGICVLTGVASVGLFRGPPPLPLTAPEELFSATRAYEHIRIIAREPHPVATPALTEVRDYIEGEIRRLGLKPVRLSAQHTTRSGDQVPVVNILVRMPGRERGAGVMLAAHYDSARLSPGASDNGVGVATLLESMRALQTARPTRRPVLFLFTDAEESGLLGARAFVDETETLRDVGMVLNFEARGTSGPAIMFETSTGNGALIAGFAKASPRPLATSLSQFVYRIMPNDTDFSVFARHGLAGLNFAFIGGNEHYHRPTDSIENVSLRSLQHTGSHALSLTRHFADLDLPLPRERDAVFFNVLGPALVYYPVGFVRPLSVLLVLFCGWLAWTRRKDEAWRPVPLLFSLAGVVIGSLLAFGLGIAGTWIGYALTQTLGPSAAVASYILAALFTAVGIVGIDLWRRRVHPNYNRAGGVLLAFLVLSCASGLALPEGSYLFFWPALLLAIGLGFPAVSRRSVTTLRCSAVIATLGAMLFCALIAPLLVYVFIALPAAAPVLVVFVGLAVWLVLAVLETSASSGS